MIVEHHTRKNRQDVPLFGVFPWRRSFQTGGQVEKQPAEDQGLCWPLQFNCSTEGKPGRGLATIASCRMNELKY